MNISKIALAAVFALGISGCSADAAYIAPDCSQIQYFGRWEKNEDVYRCAQGATYIRANFTGTSLYADLEDANAWWRVSIDGGEFRRFRPQGRHTLLAENLPQGEHKVLLVRSTEGRAGISEFRGFGIDDDAQILAPDPVKKRRLEFIGDSITAGFKNDGPGGGDYQDIEDNDMAFGPQLARMLEADYSVLAKSGEGVVHNWGEDWPGTQVHTADRYGWILYSDKKSPDNKVWNPQDFPVDGIIIALGTNDFNRSDQKRKPTHEEFVAGYEHLLQTVRQMNPGIPIICIEPVPSAIPAYAGEWIKEAIAAQREQGDNNLHYIAINEGRPLLEPSDYAGDNTHPLKSGSTKIALFLKDRVAQILGW